MLTERKELNDYTIGEVIEICNRADGNCWIHSRNPDHPSVDCMERCPFYEEGREGDHCKLASTL